MAREPKSLIIKQYLFRFSYNIYKLSFQYRYAVMQKCWKADPTDRPVFSSLTGIFDGMLQQRTVRVFTSSVLSVNTLHVHRNKHNLWIYRINCCPNKRKHPEIPNITHFTGIFGAYRRIWECWYRSLWHVPRCQWYL